mgnify:CR=1 FL=1
MSAVENSVAGVKLVGHAISSALVAVSGPTVELFYARSAVRREWEIGARCEKCRERIGCLKVADIDFEDNDLAGLWSLRVAPFAQFLAAEHGACTP